MEHTGGQLSLAEVMPSSVERPVPELSRPALDDAELIAQVRDGDLGSYGALYERYIASLRRLARTLARDLHEADDVVSEVFVNTLRAIVSGQGPVDEFGAYVHRSVRNTVAKLRTRTDTAHTVPTPDEQLDVVAAVDSPYLGGDINRAYRELPERYRTVLWHTSVEGRTPQELAEMYDMTPGAVATLSLRARRALFREYEHIRADHSESTE